MPVLFWSFPLPSPRADPTCRVGLCSLILHYALRFDVYNLLDGGRLTLSCDHHLFQLVDDDDDDEN